MILFLSSSLDIESFQAPLGNRRVIPANGVDKAATECFGSSIFVACRYLLGEALASSLVAQVTLLDGLSRFLLLLLLSGSGLRLGDLVLSSGNGLSGSNGVESRGSRSLLDNRRDGLLGDFNGLLFLGHDFWN